MKRYASILVISALALVLPAAAGTTETFDFSDFDALRTSAGITVVFEQGPAYSVVADFDKGERSDIKVRQKDGVLHVSRRSSGIWNKNTARVVVHVTAPALERVETTSGSSLKATGVTADGFKLRVTSGGTAKISGSCGRLTIEATSGGSATAKDLTCTSVDAAASSGGSVSAHASASVASDTSSGGSVVVYGDPESRDVNDSISGGSTRFK